MLPLVHERPVGVLGEGKGGKAELEGALAALFHRAARGVPRPLGVHVEIGRKRHVEQASGPQLPIGRAPPALRATSP